MIGIKKNAVILMAICMMFATQLEAAPQAFISFKFSNQSIGWEKDGYWVGAINEDAKTITFTTQRWIENIDKLSAIFELDEEGAAFVDSKPQLSGISQNDFRKDIVYKVGDNEYTVKFVSPQATGLPVVRIDTDGGVGILDRETWVTMTFALTDPNNQNNNISSISNQQIRGRGNSTWTGNYPDGKLPYRIRFRNNQQQSPFGLPAARNWVLLNSGHIINNSVGFELGQRLGLDYTCSYHHVELYLNGSYRGAYLFTEHRQADPAEFGAPGRPKVDLNEGWFVEIDRYYKEEPRFRTTSYNLPIMIKSPEPSGPVNMTNPAYEFVRNDWNELTDLMASASFPENDYRNFIDIETFVKYFLVQTIIMNVDLFRRGAEEGKEIGSTFFYKDKDGKISAGPLWDLDFTFLLAPFVFNGREFPPNSFPYQIHPWFNRFFQDPVFLARYKEIWNDNFTDNISTMSVFIDNLANKLVESAAQNYESISHFNTHIDGVKWYFNTRIAYLNEEYNKVEVLPADKDFGIATYSDPVSPQTITLVAYGEMTNLAASLQKGEESDFEISTELTPTPTGNGGYLATISIKPKDELSVGMYNDVLTLNGENQGNPFSLNVPLSFAVKLAPDVIFPTSATLTYGKALSDAVFEEGSGDGTFAFVNPNLKPTVAQSGFYKMIFTPSDNETYNTVEQEVMVIITKAEIAKPALAKAKFDYTGETITVTLEPASNLYTLTGDTEKIAPGTYTAIVSLSDPANYRWVGENDDFEPFNLSWEIDSSTPILFVDRKGMQYTPIATQYYNLRGQPLGTTKPTTPGIYIEKHGKYTQRIIIR
ncbi:MAG: CotH kinase family protein [Fibromonadaceae bacterium]|jgi:hypothetical protein|nr:CotH kinase family protein [Fibromonadaceae bacterium]